MNLSHIVEAQQFSREWLEKTLFPMADEMEKIVKSKGFLSGVEYFFKRRALSGKKMASFFYEPSTRTRCSFHMAMYFLGGKVVFSTENAREFSSVAKGENIEDTIRVISGYHPDVIVLRTIDEGMAKIAAQYSKVPIINAGDGMGQHPTQALLDIYTIQKELRKIDGISIAMVGDLARGRTVRSLSYLLGKFSNIKIYYVSPELARMRDDIKDYLHKHDIWFTEEYDLREVAPVVNVIYQTRTQKERGVNLARFERTPGFYIVDKTVLSLIGRDSIIMHPLPRNEEISAEVDEDRRAAYFRQAENGLYIRMALLKKILS